MSAPTRPGPIPADYSVIRLRNARRARADRWAVPWGNCARPASDAVPERPAGRTLPVLLSEHSPSAYDHRTEGAGL